MDYRISFDVLAFVCVCVCGERVLGALIAFGFVSVNAGWYAYWASAHVGIFLCCPFQIVTYANPNEEHCPAVGI